MMSIPTKLGDFLRVSVRCTSAVTVIITGVVNQTSGDRKGIRAIGPFTFVPSKKDATEVSENFPGLVDGELIAVNIRTSTSAVQRGQCWVVASISNQLYPTVNRILLFADYLSSGAELGFPGSAVTQSTAGRGFINILGESVIGTGANLSYTYTYDVLRKLSGLVASVSTDASTAKPARGCYLQISSTAEVLFKKCIRMLPPSSTMRFHLYNDAIPSESVDQYDTINVVDRLPSIYLKKNYKVDLFFEHATVTDLMQSPVFTTEEWILT